MSNPRRAERLWKTESCQKPGGGDEVRLWHVKGKQLRTETQDNTVELNIFMIFLHSTILYLGSYSSLKAQSKCPFIFGASHGAEL